MKSFAFGLGLLASAALLVATSGSSASTRASAAQEAHGLGTVEFQEVHHDGRVDDNDYGLGIITFDVNKTPDGITGSLLFAGEHHHGMYPDIVVRLETIRRASFGADTVTLSGSGTFHTDPVTIIATAFDGEATGETDTFSVRVRSRGGEIVLEAKGRLTGGDIVIGPVD